MRVNCSIYKKNSFLIKNITSRTACWKVKCQFLMQQSGFEIYYEKDVNR